MTTFRSVPGVLVAMLALVSSSATAQTVHPTTNARESASRVPGPSRQGGAEEAAVREALEHYLAGHATGIGAHFDSVFHETSNLYWVSNDSLRTRTGNSYIASAPGRPAPDEAQRRRRIAWVEVSGDIAVARIDLLYPTVTFTDYMSLLKTHGEWRIVSKFFHADRSGASSASAPSADPRDKIAAASRAFSQAYVSGDTATIRQLYTPEAMLLPPDREVRGPDAIARYFAPGSRATNVAHAMTSEDLRVTDDIATDVGMWRHTQRTADGSTRESSGRYLVVWRRGDDGRWRIEYDMWHRPANP